jgi:hypothetical protein
MTARRTSSQDVGTAHSIVRFGIGALSLGASAIAERARHAGDGRTELPADLEPHQASASMSIGDVGAGIAVTAVDAAGRLLAAAGHRRRRLVRQARRVGRAPVVGPLTRPVRGVYAGGESALRDLARRGRREVVAGRRMVELTIRDVTARSFNEVTGVALEQVTHSPEVADLVKTQTAGVATETIVEVRDSSRQADDRVERRIRSWLRLDGSSVDHARGRSQ